VFARVACSLYRSGRERCYGRIFVCQQNGALRVIKNGALLPNPFLTVTVDSSGERGLLGVAFDPNFVSNQLVYVYYTVALSGWKFCYRSDSGHRTLRNVL
jgi:glucose/arabinose dehydrogenase